MPLWRKKKTTTSFGRFLEGTTTVHRFHFNHDAQPSVFSDSCWRADAHNPTHAFFFLLDFTTFNHLPSIRRALFGFATCSTHTEFVGMICLVSEIGLALTSTSRGSTDIPACRGCGHGKLLFTITTLRRADLNGRILHRVRIEAQKDVCSCSLAFNADVFSSSITAKTTLLTASVRVVRLGILSSPYLRHYWKSNFFYGTEKEDFGHGMTSGGDFSK